MSRATSPRMMQLNRSMRSRAALTVLALSVIALPAGAQTASPLPTADPSALPTVVGAPQTDEVLVPKDTPILVRTIEGHSSYAAHEGEELHYEVVQDVIVNGHVVVKAGDEADGIVEEAQQGRTGIYGIGYKAADMRVGVESVHNFCGDTLKVRFDRSEYRRRQGMFGSNKDIQITKGQEYVPVVTYAQKVCGAVTNEADPPIPANAMRTATH